MSETIKWKYFLSNPSKKPEQLLLILHGCGGNGDFFIPFAEQLCDELGGLSFVAVAPEATIPSCEGENCYQWFDIETYYSSDLFRKSFEEFSVNEFNSIQSMLEGSRGLFEISKSLNNLLDILQQRFDIGNEQTTIIGYSQGAMVSLDMGLNRANPIRRIISISGCTISPYMNIQSPTPVTLIHGENDGTVDIASAERTQMFLEQNKVKTDFVKLKNLSHGKNEEFMDFWKKVVHKVSKRINPMSKYN